MSYLGRSAKLSLKAQEKVSFLATAGQTVKTGLSYTPSFIEVYVNGVLLTDNSDFTATNGNSITFTVALLLNDEVTVISLKTFTVADHYTKSDADVLLAAKLPLAGGTMTGAILGTVANRLSTDGTIVDLQKDGTSVGSIGVLSNRLYAGTDDTGLFFSNTTNGIHPWNTTSNSARDAGIDLGNSSRRFKDLYLSGGVYLGGTGAANKLDDYEEGTWTPVITSTITPPTVTYSARQASYTKVGRVVSWNLSIQWSSASGGTGTLTVTLPFAANATGGWQGGQNMSYAGGINVAIRGSGYTENGAAYFYIGRASSNNANVEPTHMANSGHLIAGGTFQTNS